MDRRHFLSAAALLAVKPQLDFRSLQISSFEKTHISGSEPDWEQLRNLFPLEKSKTYLNNGTMGITPYPVLMELERAFRHVAEHAAYPSHNDKLQKAIGDLIGAAPEEIAITKNVSEGTNHTCWGIDLRKKDEVILTTHEHVGGSLAWMNRARLDGIVIKTIEPGKDAAETLERIDAAITKKTRVIAVPHIPCTTGQIFPVKEICSLARSKGIISAIDGAHPLGMIQFNVKDIGCDYYYGCVHKWALGPVGVGFFYASNDVIDQTRCTHIAAYSSDGFNMKTSPPDMGNYVKGAQRFSYGTFCGPLLEGALKALNWYNYVGPAQVEKRSRGLATTLQQKVMEFEGRTEMVTPTEDKSRGCQIGFRIKNGNEKANSEFVNRCREKGIILRYVGESGIDCIRVSTHYYNNEADIDLLIAELKATIG